MRNLGRLYFKLLPLKFPTDPEHVITTHKEARDIIGRV